jgi:hypothetical protein
VNIANQDPQPLIDAIYWIETVYRLEGEESTPTSLLKNGGLAHLHLVQNKVLAVDYHDSHRLAPTKDIFHTLKAIDWPQQK